MIRLRTATLEDIPALANVLANVSAQTDPTVDVEKARTSMIESIPEYFGKDEPESLLSLIELDGEPIGRFRVVRFKDRIFLGGIQILPDFQNRGIGTQLIMELVDESRTTGRPLQLDVERSNSRARRLYERLGFRPYGESETDIHMQFLP
ncbi:GNAT family N-acetyltransferase [Microlunatus soli]|uniref:Acetyltransferase (GNAT) family protein n=1 Tax=Microlunatus soli TaxID=630515 RepID=A0A1H1S7S8_9ACTN|nr:GNAT family N-acetyltransferase [Microlunatus soli]SDS43349.1 Acetyltransferase (GNAT) family protein [Microlunatus soli]